MRISNKRLLRNIPPTLLVVLLLASACGAQFSSPNDFLDPADRRLFVDHACFRSDDPALVRIELYYKVFNQGLTFAKTGDEYEADFAAIITVDDKHGDRVETITLDKHVTVKDVNRTRSVTDFRTSQINLDLPPGEYKVEFALRDKGSSEVTRREFKVKAPSLYGEKAALSGVEFVQAFSDKTAEVGVFNKGDKAVIPSVTHTYGGDSDARLLYYLEAYPGSDSLNEVVLKTSVRHRHHGLLYRDTVVIELDDATNRQLCEISLDTYAPGEYELELRMNGRRGKKLQEEKYNFEVLWSLNGLILNDWESTIGQVEIISDPEVTDDMKELTTFAERRRAFEEFWLERDPTPGTTENEVRRMFYRRVAVANHNFGIMVQEGWATDRGRIFIKYGEPDQFDDEPFATNSKPYQIWHYFTSGPYRKFIFVDEREDGDYRLRYPYDGLYQRPSN